MSKLKKVIERDTISVPFKRGERNVRAQPNWVTVGCVVLSKLIHLPGPPSHLSHETSGRAISEVPPSPNKLALFCSGNHWDPFLAPIWGLYANIYSNALKWHREKKTCGHCSNKLSL